MAGRNTRDVALVIKARDEATKTFDAVADALQNLVSSQGDLAAGSAGAQNRLAQFTNILLSLDKAAANTASGFDTASQSIERMQQRAAANSSRFDALTREAESLSRVVTILSTEADKAFVGPRRNGLTEALRAAKGDLTTLNREISGLSSSISRDLAGVGSATSPLQQLASTERAVAEASQFARAQIEMETKALRDLEAQASRLTPIQSRINSTAGVSRPDATGSASAAADLLLQADAQYKVTQARNAEIQKLREQQDATTSLSREQEAQRRSNDLFTNLSGSRNGYSRITGGGGGGSARESAGVFAEAETKALKDAASAHKAFEDRVKQGAAAMREEEAAVERLRADLDPLATVTARASAEQAKLEAWHKRGKLSATEYAAATKKLAQETKEALESEKSGALNRPQVSLFGLRPYETQNLLYQVNDIVTQLGSGTSLSQTLAQQGGQIFQLFQNRIGPSIAAAFSNPYFLTAAATLGVFVLGLKRAADELERMRNYQGFLSSMADGGDYNAQGLSDATKAMERYGVASVDATKAVQTFVREGINSSRLADFGKTAKDMADVLGIEVPEAASKLANAFDGSFDSVQKLDKELNFLTAEQYENIKALFEQGRAADAMGVASDALRDRFGKAAQEMRGPWADSIRELKTAWGELLDRLADSAPVQWAIDKLAALARGATATINAISGTQSAADLDDQIRIKKSIYGHQLEEGANGKFSAKDGAPVAFNERAKELNELIERRNKLLADAKKEQDKITEAVRTEGKEREGKANSAIEEGTAKLREQGRELSKNERLQKAYNDALKEAQRLYPNASPDRQAEYANAAKANEQGKINKEDEAAAKSAAAAAKAAGTMEAISFKIIANFEQFRSKAYWDVNAWRTGYGSDTTTDAQGRVRSVTQNTVVDKEGATRDLERRIKEFSDTVKRQIGSERYGAFSPEQQASLNSIAYNYGSLPDRILGAVRKGNAQEIVAAIRALGGDNAGINRKRRNQEAAIFENPNRELEVSTSEIEKQRTDAQEKFNEKLADENEKRRQSIESLQRQTGLTGEALVEEQKRQAVASAILQKQQEYERLNRERAAKGLAPIEASKEELAEVERSTRAYEDLARAKDVANARRTEIDNPVRDLTAQRDAIQQQIKFLSEQGNTGAASALGPQLADVNARLNEAIEKAKTFYAELSNNPQAMAALGLTAEGVKNIELGLKNAQVQAQSLGYFMGYSLDTIAQKFTGAVVNAVDKFAQKVAAGENVFKSLKDAFLQFASDFLRQIAQMILQQTVFNLVSGVLKGIGGGATGGAGANHSGGLASGSGMVRGGINPAIFTNAMRLHTGGIAGLGPNEVPRILERDEEVLTRSDPRHILNGGKNGKGGAAPIVNVQPKIINTIDPGEMMSQAMNTRVGQKAILNMVSENRDAFKQAMG